MVITYPAKRRTPIERIFVKVFHREMTDEEQRILLLRPQKVPPHSNESQRRNAA